jgi:NADPH-dependent ferric siderophore reductase
MFEIKGETYTHLLSSGYSKMARNTEDQMLDQSARQIAASGGRPIIWVFAEKEAAEIMRGRFNTADQGREFITVMYVPWTKRNP